MSKMLKVTAIVEKISETVAEKQQNGGRYRVVTLQGEQQVLMKDSLGVERVVRTPHKTSSTTAWIDSPIPGRTESDFLATCNVGDHIPGAIVEREVEPYFIAAANGPSMQEGKRGRFASTASVIVLGNTEEKEDWDMQVLKSFRQRNYILKGRGNAGAPGGSIEAALERPRTKVEGQDTTLNLPINLQPEARDNPQVEEEYAQASAERNQDDTSTAR